MYEDQETGENGDNDDNSRVAVLDQLPRLEVGDRVDLIGTYPEQHFTQPPRGTPRPAWSRRSRKTALVARRPMHPS